jgi:hypothetical protein
MLLTEALNFYMLLCGNNTVEKKILYSSMANHVYMFLYTTQKKTDVYM